MRIRLYFKLLVCLLTLLISGMLIFLSAARADDTSHIIKFQQAAFLVSAAEQPPDQGSWKTATLPDEWQNERYLQGDNGWYRFEINWSAPPTANWGCYLPRLNMNAAVYLNGYYLGDGGSFAEPIARNWNRPLYFTIPAKFWKSGRNVFHVRLKSYQGYGRLDPVAIGPESELRPLYEKHVLVQNDINTALIYSTLFASLFVFGIWLRRRTDNMYLWYAVMALIWTLFTSNTVIKQIPVSAKTWDWITYTSTAWWTVSLAIFAHRMAKIRRPRLETGFFIWAGLSALAYALTDLRFISQTTVIWQVGSIVIGFIVVFELLLVAGRERYIKILGASIALVLLTGIHDWLVQSNFISHWFAYGSHLLPFSAPLLILYIGWFLTGRFIKALNESEELNISLEQRANEVQMELTASFAARRTLEMEQAATSERERIYRDLHDDVGAKLLGLVISAQRANLLHEADLARSALQDLRDVVSRSAQAATPLEDLLADLRAETEQRIHAAGLKMQWHFPEQYVDITVSAEAALNLSRILREAVTNVLRHANANCIEIVTRLSQDSFSLEIIDNGVGCPQTGVKFHRGMMGMQSRANILGGNLQWLAVEPSGCKVLLEVPLQRIKPEKAGNSEKRIFSRRVNDNP
jgi:signal transduction histidine kinase